MPELIDHDAATALTPPMGIPVTVAELPTPQAASIAPPDSIGLVPLPAEPLPLPLEPTPLPPFPAPHPHDRASEKKSPVLLATIATIAAIAALGFAWLWLSAGSRADEADQNAEAAVVERDAATQMLLENDVELQTLRDDLAAARAELDAATVPAADEPVSAPESSSEIADLEAAVATLEAEIERLTTENTALTEQLDAMPDIGSPDASPEPAPDVPDAVGTPPDVAPPSEAPPTESPASETPTFFDAATTPEFARYVGEILSSRNGGSRLGQAQSQCFGTAVIGQVGLNGLGAGLNNAATSAANNAVVEAMRNAANICNIDANLIFG